MEKTATLHPNKQTLKPLTDASPVGILPTAVSRPLNHTNLTGKHLMETHSQDNPLGTDVKYDPSTAAKNMAATSQPKKIRNPHNKTPPAVRNFTADPLAPMHPSLMYKKHKENIYQKPLGEDSNSVILTAAKNIATLQLNPKIKKVLNDPPQSAVYPLRYRKI